MSEFAYSSGNQTRTVIAAPNAWVPVIIPAGARGFLLGVENSAATFRVSWVNTINPATEGDYYLAGGHYYVEGVCAAQQTLYVSASIPTVAFASYTTSP